MEFPYKVNPKAGNSLIFVGDNEVQYETQIWELIKTYFGIKSKFYKER